jgi:glycolate oxidase
MIRADVYEELEKIVGTDYVSREPAVLDSYVWQSLPGEDPDIWLQRPLAVVLPASKEEVQAVMRVCDRNALRCAAFATGWGAFSAPMSEDVVQLDLTRMNRIIEIDTEKKAATIEPGVCAAQLQVETMKVGLNINIPRSGPCGSPLSTALTIPASGSEEIGPVESTVDLVAIEYVLPSGEILTLGDADELPGSLHGQAVITKGMVKLCDWPGPAEIPIKGLLFDAEVEVPESIRFYLCFFPDAASEAEANDMLASEHVGYITNCAAFGSLLYMLAPNLFEGIAETEVLGGLIRKVLGNASVVMLASASSEGFDTQEKALTDIVQRAGGVIVGTREAPRITALLLASYLRSAAVPRAGRGWGTASTFLEQLKV